MSDPLSPEVQGDLAEFGLSARPTTPFDEIAESEEEAQATTAVEQTIPESEEAEVQVVEEEPEQVEEAPQESILQSIMEQEKPSEESELTRLRQEKARLEGLLEGRLQAVESQIRQSVPAEEPKEEEETLLDSAPVRQVLQHLLEEDPAQYQAALAKVIEKDLERKMEARLERVESERRREREEQLKLQQGEALRRGIQSTLDSVKAQGGLEAELVDQFYTALQAGNPQASFLGKRFAENAATVLSQDGIKGAVASVAAELKQRLKSQQSIAQQGSPSVEASAGGGTASRRGVSLGEKPKQMSEEEKIAEAMFHVGDRRKEIPFL